MEQTQQPKRILQVIGIMNRGGAEAMIMNLYRCMDRTRVQFDFVENSFEEAAYDEEIRNLGGRIYHCPHFNGKNYYTYRKWWVNFFSEHPEYQVIHGHIGSSAAIYLSIAKRNGLFTIAHSHSAGAGFSFGQILYDLFSYRTRYVADYFFACSDQAAINRYGRTVASDNSRCFILKNAIDTNLYRYNTEVRDTIRKKLGVSDSTKLIGHVGRFVEAKNHMFLLEVFASFHDKYPDSKLVLVGDGELRGKIECKIQQMNLQDTVILLGVRSDVNRLFQAMDLLLFPSIYEGLPVTLVEAQTSGISCVISSVIPAESVIEKQIVICEKLDNPLEQWVADMEKGLTMVRSDHSQSIADKGFDINTTARWLEEFYCER